MSTVEVRTVSWQVVINGHAESEDEERREDASEAPQGMTNRPAEEEAEQQEKLPPRGEASEPTR